MVALAVTGGDVIHDGIAENVFVSALWLDIPALFADDKRKFGFVIDTGSNMRMQLNDIVRSNHGICRLGEDGRIAVDLGAFHCSGLVTAIRELARVVAIIFPDAEYIAPRGRNRRQQLDVGERAGLLIGGLCADLVDPFDRLEHIIDVGNWSDSLFGLVYTTDFDVTVHGIPSEFH